MREALRSHPEVRQSVESSLRMEAVLMGDRSAALDVEGFFEDVQIEKIGCAAAQGAAGYRCDFRWGRDDEELARTHSGRFFETDRGWSMAVVQ